MNPALFTTQELYRPIETLQKEHEAAMVKLLAAARSGDTVEMKRVFDLIVHLQEQQGEAARLIRQHILSKVGGGLAFRMNPA